MGVNPEWRGNQLGNAQSARARPRRARHGEPTEHALHHMNIIGLTGGIASGKSSVSLLLSAEHGIPIIDLDIIARQALAP